MKQHLPFKADNFATWATPKLLPSIPTIATTPPSSNQSAGGHSNTFIYIGLGVLTFAVIATAVYLINQNEELSYHISALTHEINKSSVPKVPETGYNTLPIDSKLKDNETTT